MRQLILGLVLALNFSVAIADDYVRGYTRRDGTYVQPYMRSERNQYRYDNYSSQGNINPYTGQRGSQRNEFSDPPAYNRSNPAYIPQQNPYAPQPNPYAPRNPYRNPYQDQD